MFIPASTIFAGLGAIIGLKLIFRFVARRAPRPSLLPPKPPSFLWSATIGFLSFVFRFLLRLAPILIPVCYIFRASIGSWLTAHGVPDFHDSQWWPYVASFLESARDLLPNPVEILKSLKK